MGWHGEGKWRSDLAEQWVGGICDDGKSGLRLFRLMAGMGARTARKGFGANRSRWGDGGGFRLDGDLGI